jgi:hypothetical protein
MLFSLLTVSSQIIHVFTLHKELRFKNSNLFNAKHDHSATIYNTLAVKEDIRK